ncbi:MAG: PEP-CTERM sorting domain-containing protein [Rhodospirillales bacterium]|nr:MAG: PEP-CTERM sorting domain-containing protein [Rhodospirillales bacterium]
MRTTTWTLALSTTALIALAYAGASPAHAACTETTDGDGNPVITCSGTDAEAIADARDNLSVIIEDGAELIRESGRPLQLDGDGQSVNNLGRIESGDDDAIRSDGTNLIVDNSGVISGGDRGIRLRNGDGTFTLINQEDGEIFARRQAVRADNEAQLPGVSVVNFGLIESFDGRAIQSRGPGTVVFNFGTLLGGEEVIEGRQDFFLENHGIIAIRGLSWDGTTSTWTDDGAVADEDGVQFSSGVVLNSGVILSTDDGIDIDEGFIHNFAGGVIVSAAPDSIRGSSAVDVDELFQFSDPNEPERRPGPLLIINEGYMEGPRAIGTDLDADSPIDIVNTGTLIGRGGDEMGPIAIDLAPNQGDTTISLSGGSIVEGDILFGGASENTLFLGTFDAGARFDGVVRARDADPDRAAARAALLDDLGEVGVLSTTSTTSTGFDVVFEDNVEIGDFLAYLLVDNLFRLHMKAGDEDIIRFRFLNPTSFAFDGDMFGPDEFAGFLGANGVAVVPVPGALPLMLTALGGLALLRRRKA